MRAKSVGWRNASGERGRCDHDAGWEDMLHERGAAGGQAVTLDMVECIVRVHTWRWRYALKLTM